MTVFNRAFWAAAADRAIRTFAQAAVAVLTAGGVGVIDADFLGAASAGLLAAVISVLTSIATPVSVGGGSGDPAASENADLDVDDIPGGHLNGAAAGDTLVQSAPEEGLGL